MSNLLPRDRQVAVVSALVEGCSMRATERMTGVNRETIGTLLLRLGDVAIDADTKLVPTFLVGKRDAECTRAFVYDVASRMRNRVQVTTDGLRTYVEPIRTAFAANGVDYAMLHKTYEGEAVGPGRYSPPKVIGVDKSPVFGQPVEELVSTSYVERQNLTVRMGVRRYTRLTNGFSKKIANHIAATALHFAYYNFVRVHQTLRVTPAMEAGIAGALWSVDDLVDVALDGGRP